MWLHGFEPLRSDSSPCNDTGYKYSTTAYKYKLEAWVNGEKTQEGADSCIGTMNPVTGEIHLETASRYWQFSEVIWDYSYSGPPDSAHPLETGQGQFPLATDNWYFKSQQGSYLEGDTCPDGVTTPWESGSYILTGATEETQATRFERNTSAGESCDGVSSSGSGEQDWSLELSGAFGIKLLNPERVTSGELVAYNMGGSQWQTCKLTGYLSDCPSKYKVTLYYDKYDMVSGSYLGRGSETKDVNIPEDNPPPDGVPVVFDLPTSLCFKSKFVKIVYEPAAGGQSCGGDSGGGPAGTTKAANNSVSITTNLGLTHTGRSLGYLHLYGHSLTGELLHAKALSFHHGDEPLPVVEDSDHVVRQIITPNSFVTITDIVVGGFLAGFKISFYDPLPLVVVPDPATKFYPVPAGQPVQATVIYENPDVATLGGTASASPNKLTVIAQIAGHPEEVYIFERTPGASGGLSLAAGNGLFRTVKSEVVAGDVTTRTVEYFSPATATVPDFVEIQRTRSFPFGEKIIEDARGTGAVQTWTRFHYGEQSGTTAFGRMILREDSNGGWARFSYDGNGKVDYIYSPLGTAAPTEGDSNLLVSVERREAVLAPPLLLPYGPGKLVTHIKKSGGVEVSRQHKFTGSETFTVNLGGTYQPILARREIVAEASTPGDAHSWSDASNSVTSDLTYVSGDHANESLLRIGADGVATFTIHTQQVVESERDFITEVWTGVPNAPLTSASFATDINAGTRRRVVTHANGQLFSEETYDVSSEVSGQRYTGIKLESKLYTDPDARGRPQIVTHFDGSTESRSYSPCCGKLTSVSHHGVTTYYDYDELGRKKWERVEIGSAPQPVKAISETRWTYDSQSNILTRSRVAYTNGIAGAVQPLERNVFNNAGALVSAFSPASVTSDADLYTRGTSFQQSHDPATGLLSSTVTKPDGATQVTIADRAGRTVRVTGTAAAPVRYEYGTATLSDAAGWGISTSTPVPYTKEIKLSAAGADTAETTTTYTDFLGRPIKTVYGDSAASRSFYNAKGQLVRQTDPDGVQTLYTYNELGERLLAVLDYDRNGTNSIPGIDLGGMDRITRTTTVVGTRDTIPVRRTTVEAWLTDGTDSATPLSTTEVSLDGLQAWQTSYGQMTHTLIAHNTTAGTRTETTTHPDLTQTIRTYQVDRLKSETRKDTSGTAVAETLYGYDAHGRVQVVSNLQAPGSALPAPDSPLATTYTYHADDQVANVRTPDPDLTRSGTGYDPQLTSYHYDAAGRVDDVTQPDNTHTYTSYWPTGHVKRTWGTRVYPSEYAYDAQGRVKTLTTWKDFAGSAGAAFTTWNYHPQRGWLSSKVYAGGVLGPSYTYWPSGRLNTRVWARGITTTYNYNDAGDLWRVEYSGDAASTVTTLYDRLGRQKTVTDAAGTLTRSYDRGLLDDESYVGGLLDGRALTRALETNTGAVTVARLGTLGATALNTLTHGYDNAGRLETIMEASGPVATLGYKPLVGALQSITTATAGTTRLATNRVIDQLGRVASVDFDNPAPGLLASRVYTYNGANQRVQVEHEDTRRWAYGYDALGQVNLAEKRQSNNSVLPGYAYAFDYDDIGNRETATANGRVSNYSSGALNRYLARGTPLWADVRGKALSTASVLVNDELATRTGEDFYLAVPVSGLKENTLKIQAARPSPEQAVTETRSLLVPAVPENFVYDADGNLTQDGLWNYQWDGENRLKVQELRPDVANATWRRIQYAYDGQGRRIQKLVTTAPSPGGTPTTTSDTRFLYDGWNLVAEYSYSGATFTLVRSHAWGLDLSGSAQGAGGVGGLLWTKVAATGKTYAAGSDANGNVFVDCADGSVAGRRDYGAFGEAVMTTGVAASLPFGFSTKFEEKETGLYYYGFRYYNPSTGRWLSRDPISERGGLNLYGFVENDGLNKADLAGLLSIDLKFSPESPRKMGYSYASFSSAGTIGGTTIEYEVDCKCVKGEVKCKVDVKYAIYIIHRNAYPTPLNIVEVARIYGHEQRHVTSYSIEARVAVSEVMSAYGGSSSLNPSPIRNALVTRLKNAKSREESHSNPGSPEAGDARLQDYWPVEGFGEFAASIYHEH
jgi:RHS repeat-associated protein